ncbi:hypothetical protein [Nocardia sp. alder85J]|uniref:hypothetical protein n=1 Tax=Nocardia sp. alder85J TaxID=2862949 RepID=UPI001CD52E98|nr:hypothetical protein [Nocardia sp. alder85J]MCX4092853.1 hypothetical protein [Nocardia sp. alder85J]
MSGGDNDLPSAPGGSGSPAHPHARPFAPPSHPLPATGGLAADPAFLDLDTRPGQRIWLLATWLWWRLDERQRHRLGHTDLIHTLRIGLSAQALLSVPPPAPPHLRPLTKPRDLGPSVDPGDGRPVADSRDLPPSVSSGDPRPSVCPGDLRPSVTSGDPMAALLAATGARTVPTPLRAAAALAARLPAPAVDRRLHPLLADLLGQLPAPAAGTRPAARFRLHTALRHLERTRADLVETAATGVPLASALHGWMLAAVTAAACAIAADPERYRATGLFPIRPDTTTTTHHHSATPAGLAALHGPPL